MVCESLIFILTKTSYTINKERRNVQEQASQLLDWSLWVLGISHLVPSLSFFPLTDQDKSWLLMVGWRLCETWRNITRVRSMLWTCGGGAGGGDLNWPAAEIQEWHGNWLSRSQIKAANKKGTGWEENRMNWRRIENGNSWGYLITQALPHFLINVLCPPKESPHLSSCLWILSSNAKVKPPGRLRKQCSLFSGDGYFLPQPFSPGSHTVAVLHRSLWKRRPQRDRRQIQLLSSNTGDAGLGWFNQRTLYLHLVLLIVFSMVKYSRLQEE